MLLFLLDYIYLECILAGLMAAAVIDAGTYRIPDRLNLMLFATGLARMLSAAAPAPGTLFFGAVPWDSALFASLLLACPMMLANLGRPGSFGQGDIKMCLAMGPALGWQAMLFGGLTGLLLAGFYGAGLEVIQDLRACRHSPGSDRKKRTHIALGPFLSIGFAAALCLRISV